MHNKMSRTLNTNDPITYFKWKQPNVCLRQNNNICKLDDDIYRKLKKI